MTDPTRTAAVGAWTRTGDSQYLSRAISFRIDSSGKVVGIIDVRSEITVDAGGDSYTGNQVVRELDATGAIVGTAQQTNLQNIRISPLPL